jgi:putative ABC transport system substrate-binding protein
MRRREFLGVLGGAAAWPVVTHAQQAIPIIGFLSGRSSGESRIHIAAFQDGLSEAGFVEGRDVAIAFQWADGQYDRLPGQAADLVRLRVASIVAVGAVQSILAAKAATATIPIVFITGDDPVKLGLVTSLNRPGGNVTGAIPISQSLEQKRLTFLDALVPKGAAFALLVNPNSSSVEIQSHEAEAAARTLGREIHVLRTGTAGDIDGAFGILAQRRVLALSISGDPFLVSRREQIIALAAGLKILDLYSVREGAADGGLMSYGPSFPSSYRQVGVYTGRILKGEKPGDLPVLQPTKFELVINLKTAKALGLTIPPTLLALADEVIE